jgi:hypothetical protein
LKVNGKDNGVLMRPNKFGTRDDIEDSPTIIKKKVDAKYVDTKSEVVETNKNVGLNTESRDLITKQDAEKLIEQAVLKATEAANQRVAAVKNEESDSTPMFGDKTIKELQQVAGVMNALKEFSANPLQKAIETKVGDVAAGVVERAFSPPQAEQKRDFLDQILNSQMAAAFGAGLGQRGPEVVDSLTKNFGQDRAYDLMSGAVGRAGNANGMSGMGVPGSIPPGGKNKQDERELILALDPNNPEHISAYAASQADLPLDVARKMLIVHQDAFIKEMEANGVDVTQIRLRKNQQMMGQLPTELYNSPNVNVQEYKSARINEDLMKNTPVGEDKKWDNDTDDYVESLQQQSVDNPLERSERSEPKVDANPTVNNQANTTNTNSQDNELMSYIKNMNEYIVGLKETVDKQNSDMFILRQEIENIKQTTLGNALTPDDRPRTIVEEFEPKPTGVKPVKLIKKGSVGDVQAKDKVVNIEGKEDNKGDIT